MDKPVSLSVKAWIIRNMSVRMMIQENVIETVVNHQFDTALFAMERCNSLEFSGFGKLFFNKKKAFKKLEKFKSQIEMFNKIIDSPDTTDVRRRNMEIKLQATIKNFEYLNTKLHEPEAHIRRVEEQAFSIEGDEGDYSEGE